MGINDEAYRLGRAARRDHLTDQHALATAAADTGDTYATAWLKGWNA